MFKWFSSPSSASSAGSSKGELDSFQLHWKSVCDTIPQLLKAPDSELDSPELLVNSSVSSDLTSLVECLVREEEGQHDAASKSTSKLSAAVLLNAPDPENAADSIAVSQLNRTAAALDSHRASTGPCCEFILHHHIIDSLCAFGLADRPLGLRSLITRTLDAIFYHTRHPLLSSQSIFLAVHNFLDICVKRGDLNSPFHRPSFIRLLRTIAMKMQQDRNLCSLFFDETSVKPSKSGQSHSNHGSASNPFLVFTAALELLNDFSEDGRVAQAAILDLLQLPNDRISQFISYRSKFSEIVVDGLAQLWRQLVPPIQATGHHSASPASNAAETSALDPILAFFQSKPSDSGSAVPDVAADLDSQVQRFATFFHSNDLSLALFDRINYLDVICCSSFPRLRRLICRYFTSKFLVPILRPAVLDVREECACFYTEFVTECFKRIQSPYLLRELYRCLFASSESVRSALIRRLDSLSELICGSTLRLVHQIIRTRQLAIIEPLAGFPIFVEDDLQPHLEEETVESKPVEAPQSSSGGLADFDPLSPAVYLSRSSIEALFPGLASLPRSLAFEDYLMDAQIRCQQWKETEEDWKHQKIDEQQNKEEEIILEQEEKSFNPNADTANIASVESGQTPADAASASASAVPSSDSLLFSILLNRLEALFDNCFSLNLSLTGIFSDFTFLSSPAAHELTLSSRSTRGRTLVQTLASLWQRGSKKAAKIQNFSRRKDEIKSTLRGDAALPVTADRTEFRFYCGIILVEEFVTELLAIVETKQRLAGLKKRIDSRTVSQTTAATL